MRDLDESTVEETAEFLSSVEMLASFNADELSTLAASAQSKWFEFGDSVFTSGDPLDGLQVVRTGSVRLFTLEDGKETSVGVRKVGEVLGEVGALREGVHETSVRASAKVELLTFPRATIRGLLDNNPDAAKFIGSYAAIRAAGVAVNRLFDLKGKAKQAKLMELINSVGVKRLESGVALLEQGQADDARLYVLRQGSVNVQREEDGTEYVLANQGPGDIVGEYAALTGKPQFATVTALEDCVLLVIPNATISSIIELNANVEQVLQGLVDRAVDEIDRQKKVLEQRAKPALFDLSSRAKLGERVVQRFQLIEQAEEMDCGAACLAMISKHHGVPATLGKLRDMANVTMDGATMESLARTGEALGFATRGMRCTFPSLLGFEMPFVAHWEGYHYIVVYGISQSHVWVADPGRGFAKLTVEEFEQGWTGNCLTFAPGSELYSVAAGTSAWVRFARYLAPFKNIIGYVLLATLVIEVLGIAPPIIMQNILDRVVVHSSIDLLNTLIIGLIIAQVFTQLTSLMRGFLSAHLIRNLDFAMISQFFRHTLSLPLNFFDSRRTGDIFARFQENQTVRDFMTESTISTLLNVMMVFIYFIVLFIYSPALTGVLIGLIIPMVALTLLVTPRLKAYARAEFEASTDAEAVLMETISGAETVKAMSIERQMRMRWESRYVKALQVQYRSSRFDLLVGFVSQMLNSTTMVLVLWLGANMVMANELTIGQLMAFNMLMGAAMSPVMGLIGLWDEIQETSVAMERLGDILEIQPEQNPAELDSRVILPDLKGELRFDDVYFRYGAEGQWVLEGIDLKISPGEMVAIVGQSGSGKTTLAKLVAGFYPATEGSIFVDGYDMNLVDKETYRSQMGYVMQNNLLFSGTVTDNIAAGAENPDKRRVMEVAKQADAHSFIAAMPLGYDQTIGERGTGLSGGQMQRLCIARALYHDPRILILDEATSALDSQSESNILSNMQDLTGGRTSIVIAHRLSTIMKADKILVLYQGSIVEDGTHEELLDREGMYHQLVKSQLSSHG